MVQLRLPKPLHDAMRAEATRRGLSITQWVLTCYDVATECVPLLKEIHEAVVTRGTAGLTDHGRDALAALRQLGMSVQEARQKVRAVVDAMPQATPSEIVTAVYRNQVSKQEETGT